MNISEFEAIMVAANRNGQELTGYILISAKSMKPEFSARRNRTYIVSSDNKRWQDNKCSNSVWANCLDGECVKLSECIWAPEKDRWEVEECGILSYGLFSTYERESTLTAFTSFKDAKAQMRKEFEYAVRMPAEEYLEENDGELTDESAWVNDAGIQDGNCDWVIKKLYNNGITVLEEGQFLAADL